MKRRAGIYRRLQKAGFSALLMTSTSLALGEAYMDGDLEIEGDLYYALDHFLGQMGQFSTDESALKKMISLSSAKENQQKEVTEPL